MNNISELDNLSLRITDENTIEIINCLNDYLCKGDTGKYFPRSSIGVCDTKELAEMRDSAENAHHCGDDQCAAVFALSLVYALEDVIKSILTPKPTT